MGVHMPTLPDADLGIRRGGVAPVYGRVLWSGRGAPAAVPQLQDSQTHKGAPARTSKWPFCATCTPLSHVHSPISTDPRRSAFKVRLHGVVLSAMS